MSAFFQRACLEGNVMFSIREGFLHLSWFEIVFYVSIYVVFTQISRQIKSEVNIGIWSISLDRICFLYRWRLALLLRLRVGRVKILLKIVFAVIVLVQLVQLDGGQHGGAVVHVQIPTLVDSLYSLWTFHSFLCEINLGSSHESATFVLIFVQWVLQEALDVEWACIPGVHVAVSDRGELAKIELIAFRFEGKTFFFVVHCCDFCRAFCLLELDTWWTTKCRLSDWTSSGWSLLWCQLPGNFYGLQTYWLHFQRQHIAELSLRKKFLGYSSWLLF